MDLMILGGGVVIIIVLIIVIAKVIGQSNPKKKIKKRKTGYKISREIDPEAIVKKIFILAPSELKKARQEYYDTEVEIRTVMHSSKKSKKGGSYREVVLGYQDNRNIHIIGDINMKDYKDQSWMTREGKLKISGVIKDIMPKEFLLDNIKII